MKKANEQHHSLPLNQVHVFQQIKNLSKPHLHLHCYDYQEITYHKVFVLSFSQLFGLRQLLKIVCY